MPAPTEDEWIAVYRGVVRPLYAYVARRAGDDRALAEDVTQEAFLRALDRWRRRGVPDEPLAWLQRVARNLLASHFRRQRPRALDPVDLELEGERLEPRSGDALALVQWGLARLRDGERHLIEARHLDGASLGEIGRELGLGERAVEGRLRRARSALRERLAPYLTEPEATP